jgi:hypothetical protein
MPKARKKPRRRVKKAKKFMAKAVKNPGSFTRYCDREGFDGPSMACIRFAIVSGNAHREKQAVLARTFKEIGARRRAKNGRK